MTVCIACQLFNLRAAPQMARLGFGNCPHKPDHVFMSAIFEHKNPCPHFRPATAEAEKSRREWIENQRGTKNDAAI